MNRRKQREIGRRHNNRERNRVDAQVENNHLFNILGDKFQPGSIAPEDVAKPTASDRAILNEHYALEHRPPTAQEIADEVFAEVTYLTKEDADGKRYVKTGPKWQVCRIQMVKQVTKWKKAMPAKHDLREIEPKSLGPVVNMRATMDLESMAQMNRRFEKITER
jgi:hypothetical protein